MNHHVNTESHPGKQIPVDLTQPLVLTIHSPNGDIAVRAVDRPDVLIGYGDLDDAEDLDDESGLKIDIRGNRIDIRPGLRHGVGWPGVTGDIDLETVFGQISKAIRGGGPFFSARAGKACIGSDIAVEVPRSITGRVEIHSASGDIVVERFSGEIALNSMSGDIRAVRTAGPLELQAASGDLMVEGASGSLSVRAASGDVRVVSAQLDGFQIQTANGDITIDALLTGDGPCRAHTASGDVRLTLRRPAEAGEAPAATLAFHTVSGDARVSSPFRRSGRGRWQSGPDNRGPHIDVTTVNGDFSAELAATELGFVPALSPADFADDAPSAPPAQSHREDELAVTDAGQDTRQAPAHDTVARLAVLEAVERGEIDIDEALRRLDAEDAVVNP